jgi:protoporphyrinogen oxidase
MASKKGQFAKVVLTINAVEVDVMKLRNWSYSTSVEEIDTTAAGDEWTTVEGGHKSWEGDAEVVDVDTYYLEHLGEKATIKFYHAEGDTTYETGTALITGVEKSAPYDDLIEQSLSFKGDGALTKFTGV